MHTNNSRIRVLICAPNLSRGGAERMSLQLLESLDRKHFEVTMYVQERKKNQFEPCHSVADNVVYGTKGKYRRIYIIKHIFSLVKLSRKSDVIIGVSEGRSSAISMIAGLINRRPVVLWIHADWNLFSKVLSWRTKLAMAAHRKAAAIVAPSKGVAEAHIQNFPDNEKLLHVIPNGINTKSIETASKEDIPDNFKEIFSKKTILGVGRLNHQKGFDLLIRAHAAALKLGSDCNLAIIGAGTDQLALEKLANDLNVSDSVHFLGFQENPYKFMSKCNAFILSSRFEGFALVVAEALACGAPVISFDCPSGPSEIMEDGKFGILVPPQDVESMAKEIVSLLSHPERQLELADKGRARARNFDADNFGLSWKAVLTSAVGNSSAIRLGTKNP